MKKKENTKPLQVETDDISLQTVSYPADKIQSFHYHLLPSITLVIRGSLEERVASKSECALPLSVVVKPAGILHEDRYGPQGALTVQLVMKRNQFRSLKGVNALFQDWYWVHQGDIAKYMISLLCMLNTNTADVPLQNAVFFDCLAALPGKKIIYQNPPLWVRRVLEEVEDTFAQKPKIQEIAQRAGVHPVYLSRMFKQYFQKPVSIYLQGLRIKKASALLVCEEKSLIEIALESGFADQSHFCRAFKQATGVTPKRYRKLVQAL